MLDTTLTRRTVTTVEEQLKRNRTTQILSAVWEWSASALSLPISC